MFANSFWALGLDLDFSAGCFTHSAVIVCLTGNTAYVYALTVLISDPGKNLFKFKLFE